MFVHFSKIPAFLMISLFISKLHYFSDRCIFGYIQNMPYNLVHEFLTHSFREMNVPRSITKIVALFQMLEY